jgi:hypothetical protein
MAKARSIGSIYAELTVRDKMSKALKGANAALASMSKASATFVAVGGAALGAAMAYNTKKTLEMAGTLDDVAANTGLAVSSVMKLRKAYELGGISADGMGKDVMKMQKAIGTAAAGGKDPFAKLGLSARELMDMNPEDAFNAIGASIMAVENRAARTTAAMEIFGKSGGNLINVFGQMEDASKFLGRMPEVMNRFAGSMARADDLINELPQKSTQFFTGFTAGVIGELLPALEMVDEFDFTTVGENLGKSLAHGVEILKSGDAWEVFKLHGDKVLSTIQASPGINALAAAINTALDPMVWEIFKTHGEIALLGLQKSPAMNALAAAINATLDFGLASENPGGQTSWATFFDKYADAGQAANDEIIEGLYQRLADLPTFAERFAGFMEAGTEAAAENVDDIQRRIDEINNRTAAQVEADRQAAAKANPGASAAAAASSRSPLSGGGNAESLVNEYARRGLSLDTNARDNPMAKTSQTVEAIFKLLARNFRVTREPVF